MLMSDALSKEYGDGSHVHHSSLVHWWLVGCLVFGDRRHARLLTLSLCWGVPILGEGSAKIKLNGKIVIL